MNKSIFVSLFCGLMLTVCGNYSNCTKTDHEKLTQENVYIDSINVETVDVKNGEMHIIVFGVLPNPAYEFDHFDVDVSGTTVIITPWALYDRQKIVIQIAVPLRQVCVVKNLKKGQYKVKVIGRASTATRTVHL